MQMHDINIITWEKLSNMSLADICKSGKYFAMPFSNDSWTNFIIKNEMKKNSRGLPNPFNRLQAVYTNSESVPPKSLFMLSIDREYVVFGPDDDKKRGQHSETVAPLVRKLLEKRLNQIARADIGCTISSADHHSVHHSIDDDKRHDALKKFITEEVEAALSTMHSGSDSEDEFITDEVEAALSGMHCQDSGSDREDEFHDARET